ncbi:twitching motility protein PilT [Rhodopseudomonas palustris]|nr:twitching motility protein PilT [Rhodopseudomonas palustris]
MIVMDASAALAMFLDEREHLAHDEVFESLADQQFVVPAHWHAEIGNALTTNVRRGRLPSDKLEYALHNLKILEVITQSPPELDEVAGAVRRALDSGLTYYDELYVRLAEVRNLPLFTFDSQMRKAARQRGVEILPV